jgi:CBS domain-containing protein
MAASPLLHMHQRRRDVNRTGKAGGTFHREAAAAAPEQVLARIQEQAIRLVLGHAAEHGSECTAIRAIAPKVDRALSCHDGPERTGPSPLGIEASDDLPRSVRRLIDEGARDMSVDLKIQRLQGIRTSLQGGAPPSPVTVRELLSWFGYVKRGYWVVRDVRRQLLEAGLTTMPDFEAAWYHAPVDLVLAPSAQTEAQPATLAEAPPAESAAQVTPVPIPRPVGILIGTLPSARKGVVSVAPDATIEEAFTLMLQHDFSQLPVMSTPTAPKGVFSWRTFGESRVFGQAPKVVRECMTTDYRTVDAGRGVLEVLDDIVRQEFVLVRDESARISGIVTTTDLSEAFGSHFEPFARIGDVESAFRRIIAAHFSLDIIRAAADPRDTNRTVESVDDLTFGEYTRLLEDPANWRRLPFQLDRKRFMEGANRVGALRNDVMHFSPDPLEPDDLDFLRTFAAFIRDLAVAVETEHVE